MTCTIDKADASDLPIIYMLFEEAIRFQMANNYIGWSSYDKKFIQADIKQGLLYKICFDNDIACIFSICFSDPLIWREREKGDAIYLHRVVLNRKFTGQKLFEKVDRWALAFATQNNRCYVRMDTWAENHKIISYYQSYGFLFIENYTTPNAEQLPLQHRSLCVALLEKFVGTKDDLPNKNY